MFCFFFFFNDTATTEIYTLSLHDALPICFGAREGKQQTFALLEEWVPESKTFVRGEALGELARRYFESHGPATLRSEEHTSELQSRQYLVCRLLLEKKKKK